eukprot:CAMPEP_0179462258 /NCGR_PEP_ID=MMETSP0799-20121207/44691_1 /TAXON_ID=46947 /ORGANISM="Geminigera cryophila, Strain CCMP2564" /LENGTH=176 /DNA_ID=CAMNT_0021265095 /DNA_START=32 /DNA_END=559 /DNA_ORIENTATION=-
MAEQSAKELRKREQRLSDRIEKGAQTINGIASKIDKRNAQNRQEVERILAVMLKGKRERENMSREQLNDCAALSAKLEELLKTLVSARNQSIPALLATVEGRLEEVRTAVLAEVTALKSRPGGLSGVGSRFGNIDSSLQEIVQLHDDAMNLSAQLAPRPMVRKKKEGKRECDILPW